MKVRDVFGLNFDGDIIFSQIGKGRIARWSQAEYRCDNEIIDTILERDIQYSYAFGNDLRVLIFPENR